VLLLYSPLLLLLLLRLCDNPATCTAQYASHAAAAATASCVKRRGCSFEKKKRSLFCKVRFRDDRVRLLHLILFLLDG
jgi:hypothetical protein